jgi:type II secretory ATPase GspE/PulE/Tfp pilus assembly ATPase PilB-like protein
MRAMAQKKNWLSGFAKTFGFGGGNVPPKPLRSSHPSLRGSAEVISLQAAKAPAIAPQPVKPDITKLEDLPTFDSVLTAAGGPLAQSETVQSQVAILDIGNKDAVILVTRESRGGHEHMALKERTVSMRFRIKDTLVADNSVLIMLAASQDKKPKEDVNTFADTEEKDVASARIIFEEIIHKAARLRATDVHFCVREQTGHVLARVDGIVERLGKYPGKVLTSAVGIAYTKLGNDSTRSHPAFNGRDAQSCTISMTIDGKHYDLRYQTTPVKGGFYCVIRLLCDEAMNENAQTLVGLGYSQDQCKMLELASRRSVGVIVVAGVTGSGKSTTLKTLMSVSPHRLRRKSYSVEDPVEYKIYGVSQISVQRTADETDRNPFGSSMKVLMRMDPDVIMVGEIRDRDSTSMLKVMVQSGHQVMTSIHAPSAIEIIARMNSDEIGLSREVLSSRSFISALVYQKLLPLSCSHCKEPANGKMTPERLAMLHGKFGIDPAKVFVAQPPDQGCERCNKRGIKGVTVASEIILPDREFLRHVREGRDDEAERYWRSRRHSTFASESMDGKTAFEHGLYKVSQGLIDPAYLEDNFEPMETYRLIERNGLQ